MIVPIASPLDHLDTRHPTPVRVTDASPLTLFFVTEGENKVLEIEVSPRVTVAKLEVLILRERTENNMPPIQIAACWKVMLSDSPRFRWLTLENNSSNLLFRQEKGI